MLLRLSRASFWLAASVAAVALWLPTGQETLLTGIALVASGAALVLWRQGLRQRARRDAAAWAPSELPALDESTLRDVAATIESAALEAASFEAALHAVARLLRSELGARDVTVHRVLELAPTQVRVARLIESQPELRFDERWLGLDASSLGQCIVRQSERGEPPGDVFVPVARGGRVDAVLELAGIGIAVEAAALARLLTLSRLTLERWAPDLRSGSVRPQAPAGGRTATAVVPGRLDRQTPGVA